MILSLFLSPNLTYSQKGQRDSLLTLVKKQEKIAKDTTYINLLNQLGYRLRFYNRDSLFLISSQAFEQSEKLDFDKGRIEAMYNLASFHSTKGDHQKAINNYKLAISIATKRNYLNILLRGQNGLALEYEYIDDSAKSLAAYLKGMELAEKINDRKMMMVFNQNLGFIYENHDDHQEAINYYETAKKLCKELGDEIYLGYAFSNIASSYAEMGKLEYAMFNVNKSIEIFEKNELTDWLAFALEVKGRTYLKQDKYEWAIYWFKESQRLYEKYVEDEKAEIQLLNGIAEANLGLQKIDAAEKQAFKAFEISGRLKENNGVRTSSDILYQIYKQKNQLDKALKYHEIFQQKSELIVQNGNKKNLLILKAKLNYDQQKASLIESNKKALAKQKNYVYASLSILFILIVIVFIIVRNERIQKNLNIALKSKTEDLEKNEIELKAINETKDKMFSIIGHDLRGPIGAFQGLLQLLRNGEIDKNEFLQFIPKLRTDIDNISFTLNNLLSWGQSQMNGTITHPSTVSLENLVDDNISLLSEIASNKSIRVVNNLKDNTLVWSDADQIDIVIRNLISNALKFTPRNGMVTITATEQKNDWQISIRDTGVGMDEKTQEMLFARSSNVTTYGTENEKGTGLGLSLCKEMVENNKGTIWVESALKKGTCFHFKLPKSKKKKPLQEAC